MTAALTYFALLYFGRHRLRCYLQFLQQDDYETSRFFRWYAQRWAFDRKGTLLLLLPSVLPALLLPLCVYWEGDPRRDGKLPLKMTARAHRICRAAELCALAVSLPALFSWIYAIAWVQALPGILALVNMALWPSERRHQASFIEEAKAKLHRVRPTVIGITGSYGKTSTKEALGQILQACSGNTFWPPKGTNTLMGTTRSIREDLRYGTEYAVIEMGAYRVGSIARVCELAPPDAAIISCVGTAHLERFRDREVIFRAKSELAQAVRPDGILVCNGDNEGARRIAKTYPKKTTLLYGFGEECDCRASNVYMERERMHFTIHWQGQDYQGRTPLLGEPALSNFLGAFCMAVALGADPEFAIAVAAHLRPVQNRLELRRPYLHDAYNSNPTGFRAALDVLAALPAQRRILVTPGVIELGLEQHSTNRELAEHAQSRCDIVLQVGDTNRAAWKEGIRDIPIHVFEHRDQAFAALERMRKEGDLILLENDLPDLYEAPRRF